MLAHAFRFVERVVFLDGAGRESLVYQISAVNPRR